MTQGKGVAGILLAGGLARRMGGGDKCLRLLGGRSLLDRIVERVAPQVEAVVLNANGDPARFADTGLPVVADTVDGNVGPLAGVLAGMEWAAKSRHDISWIATVPTDAPFLPDDLVGRFLGAISAEGTEMACAASGGRHHPVCALWPVKLRDALQSAIVNEDICKVDRWTGRYRMSVVEFPSEPYDPFFNTNRLEDLAQAETMLPRLEGT